MKIKYLDNSQFIILNRKEYDVLVTEILNKYKKGGKLCASVFISKILKRVCTKRASFLYRFIYEGKSTKVRIYRNSVSVNTYFCPI